MQKRVDMIELYSALGASAGSGKTFALSVRYIALILLGRDIRKILAITFTRKAASEMKSRIVQTFLNLHLKEAELDEICSLLDKSRDEIIALRDKTKDSFLSSELRIQTFDAFFSSILRLFSLNLGLMPDFENTNTFGDEMSYAFVQNASDELIKKIASYIHFSNDSENAFFSTIDTMYNSLSEIKFESNAKFPNDKDMKDSFLELKEYALKLSSNKNYINLFQKDIKDFIINIDLDKNYFKETKDNPVFLTKLDNFMKIAKKYYLDFENYKLKELFDLLQTYKKARFDLNKTKNLLSFSDISKLVYELTNLQNYKEMLYFRLDSKITDILIDEFQDTNVLQYSIIKPLIEECVSGAGQNGVGSFFYVGDTKQSIYRFRGGKKELFLKPMNEYNQISFNSLEKNYRSDKLLVEFVNQTFKDKIKGYTEQIPNSQISGYVEISSCQKDDIYESILNKVNLLKSHNIDENKIAILCWKNSDLENIKAFLQTNHIKAISQSSILIINSKYVRMLILYAKYCYFNDPYYKQNLEEFYNSIPQIMQLNLTLNTKEILYKMACELKLDLSDKNLLRFFEIIDKYNNFVDFILNIENEQEKSINEVMNGIQLLTVHSSKGLEFDHVIVVDKIGKDDNRKSSKFLFEYDIKTDKWQIRLDDKVFEKFNDRNFIELKEFSLSLDKEDKINQIYVAFTRAKHSLIIIAKTGGNGNSPSLFKPYTSKNDLVQMLDLEDKILGELQTITTTNTTKPISQDKEIKLIKIGKQTIIEAKDEKDLKFKSALFGSALHFMIEMMNNFDELNIQNAFIMLKNRYGSVLDTSTLNDIRSRALLLVKCEEFIKLVTQKTVLKEQDYIFNSALKRIDLLTIDDEKKEINILDYKSSKNFFEQNIDQVSEYILNLQSIYPKYKINGYLVFMLPTKIDLYKI